MSRLDAFSACYADWKLVKSRKVVQIVLEVAMEDSDAAYKLLGGMPNPAAETWVGVAKLNKQPEPQERRRWPDLSIAEQAGIRCNEIAFGQYLAEADPHLWGKIKDALPGADHVGIARVWLHNYFGVESRKKIPAEQWRAFDGQYDLWCRSGQ